jgi:hypothetical protein
MEQAKDNGSKNVTFRVSGALYAQIKREATASRRKAADWCRVLIEEHLEKTAQPKTTKKPAA